MIQDAGTRTSGDTQRAPRWRPLSKFFAFISKRIDGWKGRYRPELHYMRGPGPASKKARR